jgi:uncharacterized protein
MTQTAALDLARIAVFAKAPVAGEVKTRLAQALGDEAAATLHGELVRHALATALDAGLGAVELWCAPDDTHPFFAQCARDFGITLKAQRGEDLGERMRNAAEDAHADGVPLVIIGSDCPALTPSHLRLAANGLRVQDAVFIPAEDGGYVLVALSKPVAGLFDGMTWGGEEVMLQTRARLEAAGAHWLELPTLWDVDRPEDYERMRREDLLAGVRP